MTFTPNPLPDQWWNPSVPSDYDLMELAEFLPSATDEDEHIRVYGSNSATQNYNCLAWALGITVGVVMPEPPGADEIADVMAAVHFGPIASGQAANIIVWTRDGITASHVSAYVQLSDSIGWTSKLGVHNSSDRNDMTGCLVSHSIGAPRSSTPYGYGMTGWGFYNPNQPVDPASTTIIYHGVAPEPGAALAPDQPSS